MRRKIALLAILFITIGLNTKAQEVGVRFGNGAAIDLVFDVGATRIHGDIGWDFSNNYNALYIDALWQVLYKPLGEEALNWYVGLGGSAVIGDPFYLGAAGEVGLEYRFNGVPIVVGADWRPTFWLIESTDFAAGRWGVNVRWNFGG